MKIEKGETLINYGLLDDVRKAFGAHVFEEFGDDSENEDRHISKLEQLMIPLDEKETYVVVKTLFKHHRTTFKKTIEYITKEGEGKCDR